MATTDAGVQTAGEEPRRDKRMTLGQHFVELRRRLMICAAAIVVAMIGAFILTNPVFEFLMIPIRTVREARGDQFAATLNFGGVTTAFNLRLQIAFAIGLLLAAPVWIWQIWAFVVPALTRKEIKYTVGFAAAAIPLFFAGCAVGIWIAPHMIEIMATFVPEGASLFLSAMDYFDLVLKLLLVVGVAFVLPVFLVALNMAGIISGVAIVKGWRIAVLVATLFAAVATPAADVVSMLILAGILVVLYMLAAGLSLLLDRRKRKKQPDLFATELPE